MNDIILLLLRIAALISGVYLTIFTLFSAVRTFVLPRGDNVALTRWVFASVLRIFRLRSKKAYTYEERDRLRALFAPLSLLILPLVWIALIMLGYAFIYWGLGVHPFDRAFTLSGSSLLTLGTVPFINLGITLVEFSEATIGLGIVALVISYLPTMYSAFSRRESAVSMLEVRAGDPPSAVEMLVRLYRIPGLDERMFNQIWTDWEVWFTDVEESHTSLLPLVFFRSQKPQRSWVTAAGTILNAAALFDSTVDIEIDPQARLTLRAGYLALRSIADLLGIEHNDNPSPDDAISIARDEFDDVYDELAANGVPVRTDREQAWKDFAGWRVNYDSVLIQIARLTEAPYALWVSDRSIPGNRAYDAVRH